MPDTLQPVDPATNVHLQGRFAPVHHELDVADLEVEGTLPSDVTGAYLRNGPNPRFPPLGSYTYPLEGDAMIHGVWLEGGRARYRNRWVHTQGMAAEERAGRALFGGLMTPTFVDRSLLGPDPDPGWPFRLDPFINVVRHGGRHLALSEGAPPYEVTEHLDTVGRYDFGGRLPAGMCAHPKIDPVTGEMVVLRYDVEEPYLSWAVIDTDGAVSLGPTTVAGVDAGYLVHDFSITERFLVVVVPPVVFNLDAMMGGGGDILSWRPELGTRIGVIPRDGSGPTRWLDTEAFFVWHFANGYEDSGDIVVDFPWWSDFALGPSSTASHAGAFARARLALDTGTVTIEHLDDLPGEFPRIDDRRTGRPHRYLTLARKSGEHHLAVGEFDQLHRFDMHTGTAVAASTGMAIGEVVFAPRDGGSEELDGYYLTYGTSLAEDHSYLLVWDAAGFPAEPVAKVRMPQRVPNGLHGNWLPPG